MLKQFFHISCYIIIFVAVSSSVTAPGQVEGALKNSDIPGADTPKHDHPIPNY